MCTKTATKCVTSKYIVNADNRPGMQDSADLRCILAGGGTLGNGTTVDGH